MRVEPMGARDQALTVRWPLVAAASPTVEQKVLETHGRLSWPHVRPVAHGLCWALNIF